MLKAVAGALGLLPLGAASWLMGRLWRTFAPLDRRHRRASDQLAMAMPDLKRAERRRILSAMWDNLGRTAAETLRLQDVVRDRSRFTFQTGDFTVEGPDYRHGVVIASLHQGNWELAAWAARAVGFRAAAVYRPLRNPIAEAFLYARRAPLYDAGLLPSEGATAMKLFRLAKNGAAVCLLADLRDTTGVVIPFLGRPAHCSTLPAVLARRLGKPLVAGRVVRTSGVHFRVEAVPIAYPVTGDIDTDILAATVALNAQFETWIRESPGQWMWAHRKWALRAGESGL